MRHLYALIFLLFTYSAGAQSIFTSTGGGGDWANSASWSENNQGNPDDADGIPDADDEVVITSGNPITVSTTVEILNVSANASGLITNNGSLRVFGNITGGGQLTNGASGTLTLNGNGNYGITTLDFSAVGNTVVYEGSSNETINLGPFYNLQVNMDAGVRCQINGSDVTVNNDFTIVSGRMRIQSGNTLTVGNDVNISGANGEFEPNANSPIVNITGNVNLSNGTYDHNNGDVNITGDFIITGGTFRLDGSASTIDADQFTISNATLDQNDGTITATNASATGVTLNTNGILLLDGGTFNVNHDISIAAAGAVFTPDATSVVANISGNVLMSAGDYNHDAGDVNITGDFTITGGTFNMNGATSTLDADQMTVENTTSFNLVNGTLSLTNPSATGLTLNENTTFIHNGATLNVSNDISIANASAEYSPNNASTVANISGDILLSAGTYDHNNGDVNVTGDFNITGGTFTLNGSASTLDADQFSVTNATLDQNDGTITATNGSATGVTLSTNGILLLDGGTFNVNHDISIAASGASFNPDATSVVANISGNILMSAGDYNHDAGDVNVTGDFTITGGTFNMAGATSTLDADQMTVANPASFTLAAGTMSLTNAGATGLTLNENTTFIHNGATLNITNDLSIANATAIYRPNNASALATITGDLLLSDGRFDHNQGTVNVTGDIVVTGGDMDMNEGASNSVITATNFTITGATATLSEGDFTLSGNITLNTGATLVQNNSDGNIVAVNYTLNNDATGNHNNGSITVADVTVNASTNNLNIEESNFESTGTLTINDGRVDFEDGTGTYNFNNVLIESSGTWTVTSTGLTDPIISGNFTNNGTFNSCNTTSGCVYTFDGDNTSISGSSDISFTDLTINTTATTPNINLGRNISVTNQLSMTAGDLVLGNFNLTLGESASVTGGSVSSFIQQPTGSSGRVIKAYPTSSFSDPLSIPFGDADTYAPMTFTLNGGTVSSGAQISFTFVDPSPIGHPSRNNDNTAAGGDDDNNSGGAQAANYLNDYWEFDLTNISSPDFSATCDFSNGSFQGSTGSMFPVILRTGTPPMGSSTIDWHVVGTIADKGTGSVSSTLVTFTGINDVINTTNNWVLYAMDNADNGNGDERLPITLISFDAHRIGDQVQLDWATADEENNDFFTIERSLNGIDFQTLMTVDGAGNSASRLEYSVIDAFPAEGRNYYRLKQTDFNGQFSYSEVRSVLVDEVDFNIGLSQNPVRVGDEVRILGIERLNVETELTFITYGGQVVGTSSAHTIRNNGLRFTKPGLYLIKVADQGNPKTLKLIVR